MSKIKWACPKCGAGVDEHGKGGPDSCNKHYSRRCGGFICDCQNWDHQTEKHGEVQHDPCEHAVCEHCGWEGRFPPLPKKLKPWEKQALKAGWTPPKGWGA